MKHSHSNQKTAYDDYCDYNSKKQMVNESHHDETTPENFKKRSPNGTFPLPHRAMYSAKVDRFVTNGIIIVGILLILVFFVAFLV